jgi:hypothetical protein
VLLERVDPADELVAVRHADRVRACVRCSGLLQVAAQIKHSSV